MNIPDNYNYEEINLHRAVQLISLTGVNIIDPIPDDSQNTAVWDANTHTILGRKFVLNRNTYQIGIRLTPFELVLLDDKANTVNSIDIGGLDQSALYSIWEDWLISLGSRREIVTKLHYDLPENEHYTSNQFGGITKEFAQAWAELRTIANKAMGSLNILSGINSEINIWPHHFDTGVFYPISEENGETTQSIGAGFGIADSLVNEPYFYIYGWTKEGSIDYTKAPQLNNGTWLTETWQGAVLKASDASSLESVHAFFELSYKFLVRELKK